MTPKIIDGFTFFKELDILELRFKELYDLVDQFILVEAPLTFSGQPKPLYFADSQSRFQPYLDKITHIVVDDIPVHAKSAWEREYFQRNAIARGLKNSHPHDWVVIGDVDEIPKPRILRDFKAGRYQTAFYLLETYQYIFKLNVLFTEAHQNWVACPRIVPARDAHTPQAVRTMRYYYSKNTSLTFFHWYRQKLNSWQAFGRLLPAKIIKDAAWHFTYIGDETYVREKIQAYSHQEFNNEQFLNDEKLKKALNLEADLLDRNQAKMTIVDLETLPQTIQQNPGTYQSFLAH